MPTDISLRTVSEIAHASGFQVCPYFIGHGIGSHFHCHPEIWHHGMLIGAHALVCVPSFITYLLNTLAHFAGNFVFQLMTMT